ncbi:MAG: hypothetical protein ACREEM_15920 [Blastocatellia bacterium]
MSDMRLDELNANEFQDMMNTMLSDEFDKVTATEFFGALDAMDEATMEVIELTGHIKDGELVLDRPAPLPVNGSEILVNDKRIIIRLRDAAVA